MSGGLIWYQSGYSETNSFSVRLLTVGLLRPLLCGIALIKPPPFEMVLLNVREMYERETDGRREVALTDIEALVLENHLVRKIEKVMDCEWIYESSAILQRSKECEAGNRSGGADQNGTAPAPVQNPFAASDPSGVRGECSIPLVSGVHETNLHPIPGQYKGLEDDIPMPRLRQWTR